MAAQNAAPDRGEWQLPRTVHGHPDLQGHWTKVAPRGGGVPFTRFDEALYEYACHEGNHTLSASLSGARYGERREKHK